ncbi:MAG: hypothetical protein P8170_09525 [Gemmatimonadota bacterium]|jgi:hypothetical protein
MARSSDPTRVLLAVAVAWAGGACGPSHRLGEYDFRGATLSTVAEVPTTPDILTGPHFVGTPSNAVEALLDLGSRAARELSVRSIQDKLERATERVNVGAILEDEAQRRASRYLRAETSPTVEDSDFLLEMYVYEYGIEASDWDASAYFFIDAEATLLDQNGAVEVWRAGVKARDPVGPEIFGEGVVRDVVTATAILDLSEEDMVRALERLAGFAATEITGQLREDLLDVQRRD